MDNLNVELLALRAELEGMVAENQYRKYYDHPPAYVEDSFAMLASKIRELQADLSAKAPSDDSKGRVRKAIGQD